MIASEIYGKKVDAFLQTKEDQLAFEKELIALQQEKKTSCLVRKNTIGLLQNIYLSLVSEQPLINIGLTLGLEQEAKKTSLLKDYFDELIDDNTSISKKSMVIETFVYLCSKQIDKDYLYDLLNSDILSFYPINHLHQLRSFYQENLLSFIDCYLDYGQSYSDDKKQLLFDFFRIIDLNEIDENTSKQVAVFFKEILPLFVNRFAHRMNTKQLYQHPDKIVSWFIVWRKYQLRTEEEIEFKDDYYSSEFSTIVKYVTEFIWWNNGLNFTTTLKRFCFGSQGFFHLAKGGSIRNAPKVHCFTRRMAKVFVNLPYYFNQDGLNMFIYCYGKALGAKPLLLEMLQQFMRFHQNVDELKAEQDRWNPVIQKLTSDEFERIGNYEARLFMGYLYHCLRDKSDFTVQRKSIAQLRRESNAYNIRIQERLYERQRLQRERQNRVKVEKMHIERWAKHKTVESYKDASFVIIELTSSSMLEKEGIIMHHCVGSYVRSCKDGDCTIWSLRKQRDKKWYSYVTIELSRKNKIRQMSTRFNGAPKEEHLVHIRKWARKNEITI